MVGNKKRYLSESDGAAVPGPGGSTSGDPTSCDITTQGTLRSPDPRVVVLLKQDDRLGVEVASINGLQVLRATHDGRSAGVVDCPAERELVRCIGLGNVYVATVLRIHGGAVSLIVRRA